MSSNAYTTVPTLGLLSGGAFSAILTFALLGAGTAAIGSEFFAKPAARTAQAAVATSIVMLPEVVVTGRRAERTQLADTESARATRAQ